VLFLLDSRPEPKPETSDLLGCEVSKIGTHSAAEALERLTPLYSGSKTWAQYTSTYTLTSAEILRGLDLIPDMIMPAGPSVVQMAHDLSISNPWLCASRTAPSTRGPNLAPRSFEPEPGLIGPQLSAVRQLKGSDTRIPGRCFFRSGPSGPYATSVLTRVIWTSRSINVDPRVFWGEDVLSRAVASPSWSERLVSKT
jgi:hypothetical protein